MELKIAFAFTIVATFSGCTAANENAQLSQCTQESKFEIAAAENDGLQIIARSCGNDEGTGSILIETYHSGSLLQEIHVDYDSFAFSLNLESIDINNDGIADLALNTGGGKGGEGVFYWTRDTKTNRYQPVGEFSMLSACAGSNGILYSVTPASGEVISNWAYYRFLDNELKTLFTVDVQPDNNKELFSLVPSFETDQEILQKIDLASHVAENDFESYLRAVCGSIALSQNLH